MPLLSPYPNNPDKDRPETNEPASAIAAMQSPKLTATPP